MLKARRTGFWHNVDGTALIEFGVALPVLLTLFYGAVELTRYILFTEKMESAAVQIIDVVNQQVEISADDLNRLHNTIPWMMLPLTNTEVLQRVTVVERTRDPSGTPCRLKVLWSYGPGASRIDPEGANRLPDIAVMEGDTVTVIEMIGNYRPILDDVLQKKIIGKLTDEVYVRAYARPRYGAFRCHPVTRICRATPCL